MMKVIAGDFKIKGTVKEIKKKKRIVVLEMPIGFWKKKLYAADHVQSVELITQRFASVTLNITFTDGKSALLKGLLRYLDGYLALGHEAERRQANALNC